jgi:RecA-family ATPase
MAGKIRVPKMTTENFKKNEDIVAFAEWAIKTGGFDLFEVSVAPLSPALKAALKARTDAAMPRILEICGRLKAIKSRITAIQEADDRESGAYDDEALSVAGEARALVEELSAITASLTEGDSMPVAVFDKTNIEQFTVPWLRQKRLDQVSVGKAKAFCMTKFQDKPVPERKWIVPNLIPDRNNTLLTGPGGIGKSLLALQLMVGVAYTGQWIGEDLQKGVALYLCAEDEEDEIQKRASDLLLKEGVRFSDLESFYVLPYAGLNAVLANFDRDGKMVRTDEWKNMVQTIEAAQPKLVVIDTLADVFNGNEISRVQSRSFVNALLGVALKHDCAFVILAHPSVSGAEDDSGRSGSTGWGNSVRSRLYLKEDKNIEGLLILELNKTNRAKKGTKIGLRYDGGVLVREDVNEQIDEETMKAIEAQFLELLEEFTRQGRNVSDKPRAGNYAPKIFADQPHVIGLDKKKFEFAMNRLLKTDAIKIVPDGPPSKNMTRIVPSGWEAPKEAEKATAAGIALMALEQAILSSGVDYNGHTAVTIGQWREAAYAAGITESENPGARQKAFRRAQQLLVDEGRIVIDGDHAWLFGPIVVEGNLGARVWAT